MTINNHILEAIGLGLVHSLWQGAALLFLILLALVSLRNKKAKTRYSITLVGILALPLMLACNLYYFWPETSVENLSSMVSSTSSFAPNFNLELPTSTESPQSNPTVLWLTENASTIALIWLFGMSVFVIKVIGSFVWMRRLTTKALTINGTEVNRLLNTVKALLGITREVQLKSSSWIKSPVILGAIRPTILLPIGLIEGLSVEEVEAILYHELAHLKRNDFVINIIINVLQIVFFYHPAYWWMKSQLDNEREYATDELALKYSEKKLPMIKALAKVQAYSMNQPGLAFAGNSKNQVLKRINIMMNSKQQPNWLSATLTIAILLVAFGLMSVQDTQSKTENAEETLPASMLLDLDSASHTSTIQPSIGNPEFDRALQSQDNDSLVVSKAILEMVNKPNAFIFEFDEEGELLQITKDGKELKSTELINYKQAYTKLVSLGLTKPKTSSNSYEEQVRNELRQRQEEIRREKRDIVRYNLNDKYEVDSIWFQGKLLEGDEREFYLKNYSYGEKERLEKEYLRLQELLKRVQYPGNIMDSAEVDYINKYQALIKPLQEKLILLNSSLIPNNESKIEVLAKRIAEIKAELNVKSEFDNIPMPKGDQRLEFAKIFLVDDIHPNTLIQIDGEFRPMMKLADLTEEEIMSIESIDLIKGSQMLNQGAAELIKGKSQIMRLNKAIVIITASTPNYTSYTFNSDERKSYYFDNTRLNRYEQNGKLLIEFEGKLKDEWNLSYLKENHLKDIKSMELIKGVDMENYYPRRKLEGANALLRVNPKK